MRQTGDYHTHSMFSHGSGTIEDNVKAAIAKGMDSIAITDHGFRHVAFCVRRSDFPYLRQEVTRLRQLYPNIRILLLEPFVLKASATEANWDYFLSETRLRAQAVKRIADDAGQIFVPLQASFDAACELAEPAYWAGDGVHPTPAGHRLIAREWLAAFDKAGL